MMKWLCALVCVLCSCINLHGAKIGLLVMATGKYISFIDRLLYSADKHFCKNHEVTYFVFTDSYRESTQRVVYIPQKRLGWPFDTMMRYHVYLANAELLRSQDYLFCLDADMLFVGDMGDEILGKRVATLHPCFVGTKGTYDKNPQSTAYIPDHEGECYFAGGFYGGETEEVLHIAQVNSQNIDNDLARGVIAIWHDESHWNRYCATHRPTKILDPSYCYPEGWSLPYIPKLYALNKNHQEMRSAP